MHRMAQATNLKQLRDSLGVTQEQVVRRTTLSLRTYVRAEDGEPVTNKTARLILSAFNEIRAEQGQSAITMDDLGLTLY